MLGRTDLLMGEAADLLDEAGHAEPAALRRTEVVGRSVLDGRWTFQIVEEYGDVDDGPVRDAARRIRDDLLGGRRHVFEAEMKERRRTTGHGGHEGRPPLAHADDVVSES